MTPGEIQLVWFPFSKHEPVPYKQRPVLVVRSFSGLPPDQAILVAMITSNGQRLANPRPGDVVIADWQKVGLRAPSVVRTQRLWTAERRDFVGWPALGTVDQQLLDDVLTLIRDLLK